MKKVYCGFILLLLLGFFSCTKKQEEIKIGFVVKNAQSSWFQDEWRFAEEAGKEKGFTVVKIEAVDGDSLLTAIDNLGAQKAQGMIVCVPDVKLGPAVVARAKANKLKLITVDDRLLGSDGTPLEEVHHMGISAFNIGRLVGEAINTEMNERNWNLKDVYAVRLSINELPTAKARTDGATDALLENGFIPEHIIDSPQKVQDSESSEGSFNASSIAIAKTPAAKKWVIYALNDESVLGGIRALEGNGFLPDDVIGIGINGSATAISELKKQVPTGFFGTIVISPKRHGYETAMNMYEWIVNDTPPEKLILTAGKLATRENYREVRTELGLE